MASTLRDELASLKIERRTAGRDFERPRRGGRGGIGRGLLSAAIWTIPVAVLTGAGLYGYKQYERLQPSQQVAVGLVQSMTSGEAEKLLSAKGYIKSRHQAMIGVKVAGRVETLRVEEGSKVKKHELIAVLEHNHLKAILESRKAMLERTEAELQEAEFEFRDKEHKAQREVRLRSQNHSSTELVEAAQVARDMASSRVWALKAAIKLQSATILETEETIRDMHIVAPFDGTVVSREAEVGETILVGGMGGSSGRGSVVQLADLRQLDVETDIAENLLSRVALGQPAEIAVSAVPGRHYRGRLRQIIPMGDRARGTIKVKVEVLDPDDLLFPELVATVHFLPDKEISNPTAGRTFIYVPKSAVFQQGGHAYAWVVDDKAHVHQKRIEVVESNDDLDRVDAGLKGGESVVLKPGPTLREGQLVKVAD
ncbi:MAG TPA: efflux RND transporter periplasmic adaptor subunit [Isosphaeraceae bacterium]|nr:efflux RND transporter periplasmic adaptor subunit [Isosphaeraceae bacterium]